MSAQEHKDPTAISMEVDPRARRMRGTAYHGGTRFDVPFISEITGTLWTGGCEDGLVLPDHIVHLISLYPWEAYEVGRQMRSQMAVRMYDSEDQGFSQVDAIADWVLSCMEDGPTLVHCQAGLNRSGLVAARALIMSGAYAPAEAIGLLREKRSPAVLCNESFEAWLLEGKGSSR